VTIWKPLICLVAVLLCAGCAELKFSIKVDQTDPLKLEFTEDIMVEGDALDYLATLEKPGETDFWQTMRRLAKRQNLTLKEKAANHLILTGTFDEKAAQLIPAFVGEQFMELATSYGATRLPSHASTLPIQIQIRKKSGFFSDLYAASCEFDFSGESLSKQLTLPQRWEQVFLHAVQSSKISMVVQAPLSVKETNGTYDPGTNTVGWEVRLGTRGRMTATFEKMNWINIAATTVMAIGLVALAAFLIRRGRGEVQKADIT
jgi:hypothetical protein